MTKYDYAKVCEMGKNAREAAIKLGGIDTVTKNKVLREVAAELRSTASAIVGANKLDMDRAAEMGKDDAFLDRLLLTEDRVAAMAQAVEEIADLDDPVGRDLATFNRPNGLVIKKRSTPLGVLAMIYESRPNVGADASALAFKSGNAIILRGGKESLNSSALIIKCFKTVLERNGLSLNTVQLVESPDREVVKHLLGLSDYIDMVIPRGGKGLVSMVQEHAKVPTLLHLDGNCHTYIHEDADVDMAVKVVANAKLRRTGICGATESLVIDEKIAGTVLSKLLDAMPSVEFKGDDKAAAIDSRVIPADPDDFTTEYLAARLSVKIVSDLKAAIIFVNTHSSGHTEAIITANEDAANAFVTDIDSAVVMHNASTQFSDGGEFGMGAEIGIATGKVHARGPVGVEQLNTFKYVVYGNGNIRP